MPKKSIDYSPFNYKDYKECLRRLLSDGSGDAPKGQKSALAKAAGCQLSYLSRVLNDSTHFSLEQGEATCRFFSFNKIETDYFLALLSFARAGTPQLREYWQTMIERFRTERLRLDRRVKLHQPLTDAQIATYYSDWYFSAVHVMASIPRFQSRESLARALRLEPTTISQVLNFLVSANLMATDGTKFWTTQTQIHLAKGSPHARHHHLNWKMKSVSPRSMSDEENFHYLSVASLSKDNYMKAKEILLSATESVRNLIRESKDEMAAVCIVDLFNLEGGLE